MLLQTRLRCVSVARIHAHVNNGICVFMHLLVVLGSEQLLTLLEQLAPQQCLVVKQPLQAGAHVSESMKQVNATSVVSP